MSTTGFTPLSGLTTIASFVFDPTTAESVWQCIEREAVRLVSEQGLHAFEMPRSAAIAHETGHVIVGVHDGAVIASVDISRRVVYGRAAWGGYTKWAEPYAAGLGCLDPAHDPPRNILLRICTLIAGVIGERAFDAAHYREGSSLDEIVVSQLLADLLTQRDAFQGCPPKALWDACWRRTVTIIRGNQKVASKIMAKLDTAGIVRSKQLARFTNDVRRLSDDPLDRIIKGDE